MIKKKGIPDDDFGPIPDDEVDKYDEDDELFDDDLDDDDLDDDEDDLEELDGAEEER